MSLVSLPVQTLFWEKVRSLRGCEPKLSCLSAVPRQSCSVCFSKRDAVRQQEAGPLPCSKRPPCEPLPAGLEALLVSPLHTLLLAAWGDCWLEGLLGFMTLIPICVFPKSSTLPNEGQGLVEETHLPLRVTVLGGV